MQCAGYKHDDVEATCKATSETKQSSCCTSEMCAILASAVKTETQRSGTFSRPKKTSWVTVLVTSSTGLLWHYWWPYRHPRWSSCTATSHLKHTNYMILGPRCYGQRATCSKRANRKSGKIDERQLRAGYDDHERKKDILFEHAKGRKLWISWYSGWMVVRCDGKGVYCSAQVLFEEWQTVLLSILMYGGLELP